MKLQIMLNIYFTLHLENMESGIEVNCYCTLSLKISRLNRLLALQMQQICRSLLAMTSRCSPPPPAASHPTSSPPSTPTLSYSTSQPDGNTKRRGNIHLLPAQTDSQEGFFLIWAKTKTRANERSTSDSSNITAARWPANVHSFVCIQSLIAPRPYFEDELESNFQELNYHQHHAINQHLEDWFWCLWIDSES